MATFTAAEVREMQVISECGCGQVAPDSIGFFCSFCRRRAMLDAFAARLEQDETPLAQGNAIRFPSEWTTTLGVDAREEGRREILREIRECDAIARDDFGATCVLCGSEERSAMQDIVHKPDCLWLRAQQTVTASTT